MLRWGSNERHWSSGLHNTFGSNCLTLNSEHDKTESRWFHLNRLLSKSTQNLCHRSNVHSNWIIESTFDQIANLSATRVRRSDALLLLRQSNSGKESRLNGNTEVDLRILRSLTSSPFERLPVKSSHWDLWYQKDIQRALMTSAVQTFKPDQRRAPGNYIFRTLQKAVN